MASPRPTPPAAKRPLPPSSAPTPDRQPEEIIGDFKRGKEIGKGSFATVYLAQHRKKKSYAAVKVVAQSKLNTKLKANLLTEVGVLREINHPHVVALFATQDTPMYYYLVMEYCQLSDLSQFLKKRTTLATLPETQDIFRRYPNAEGGGFNEVLCRHFIKQIASALDYLRKGNWVHRDIKPQNLLLNPAPSYMHKQRPEDLPLIASEHSLTPAVGVQSLPMIKLADFGFARHLLENSMAETLCGSPLYMAPEILRYEKYDAKADLWSAGAVLYEMVVGKAPFRANNHVELLKRIDQAQNHISFDRKLVLSRPMKELIRKLLNKSPLERVTYDGLAEDPVITGEIPGLVEEDKKLLRFPRVPQSDSSEASSSTARPSVDSTAQSQRSAEPSIRTQRSQEGTSGPTSRRSSNLDIKPRPDELSRRKTSTSSDNQGDGVAQQMERRPSQREQPKQRRPSMVTHATAPARQDLLNGAGPVPSPAPRMERRPSRASPLTGPPMVREPSTADPARLREGRTSREAQDRTAQEIAFEKEYVVIEKRTVEINAFADELDAHRDSPHNAMTRRATTQGHPAPVAGVQPASSSKAMQVLANPHGAHQRTTSFERRYAPNSQSAQNMLTKALNAANVRLFGALGTSPPFGKGLSPPRGYGPFPTYPASQGVSPLGDGNETKAPMDEDTKIIRTMEDAGHRSEVIFGFADVKYRQLVPAVPSAQDALGIQQIGAQKKAGEEQDNDMTVVATVGVAEEALVLFVKTLSILMKTIDLAGYWWSKQNRLEPANADPAARPANSNIVEMGKRVNNIVQWARDRYNQCCEKSEIVARRLKTAQKQLPEDHPGHPNNRAATSSGTGATVTASVELISITTGVTAEMLMYDRAREMSKAAALAEITAVVGEDLSDCELGYATSLMLFEAVLEDDDEPLMRKPSMKKDKPADEIVNGLETASRQAVIHLVEGTRTRLSSLRKKIHAAQQSAKRSSHSSSGNATPKPTGLSPAGTPAPAGTPPK